MESVDAMFTVMELKHPVLAVGRGFDGRLGMETGEGSPRYSCRNRPTEGRIRLRISRSDGDGPKAAGSGVALPRSQRRLGALHEGGRSEARRRQGLWEEEWGTQEDGAN